MTKTQNTTSKASANKEPKTGKTSKKIDKEPNVAADPKKRGDLVVSARLKTILHDNDMNSGSDVPGFLSNLVNDLLRTASRNAKAAGRKTVRADDFVVANLLDVEMEPETRESETNFFFSQEGGEELVRRCSDISRSAVRRAVHNKRRRVIDVDV